MNTHIDYSELFEMFLLLRQQFSDERFRPFNPVMTSVSNNLSREQLEIIYILGILTNGYLSALRVLINDNSLTLMDLVSDPSLLFISNEDVINDERVIDQYENRLEAYHSNESLKMSTGQLLKDLWSDYVCREKANHSRKLFDKIEAIRSEVNDGNSLFYLESLSDRLFLDNKNIHFRIKPELKMKISDITDIAILPSIFASRDLTFWYSGNKLLFFVSINKERGDLFEPSDMDLLYTSAFNDKTRLKMLRFMNGKNCTAGELALFLGMNASTISRHLKVFKDAGFVDLHSNDGKQIIYTINRSGIKHALSELNTFLLDEELSE